MKMVFHVGLGKNNKLPIRMVPLAVIGTWTTHLFGGSAGREGVAVQIGAAVSNNVGVWSIRLLISKTAGKCS